MAEDGRRSQSWGIFNYLSHISLAVTVPWILYKILKGVYLQRKVSELSGKVIFILNFI